MATVRLLDPNTDSFQYWREQYNYLITNLGYIGADDAQSFVVTVGPAPGKLVMTDPLTGMIDPSLYVGGGGGGATGIASITGGTIDNTVIGGTVPANGTFTNLTSTGNTTLGDSPTDNLTVNATPNFLTDVIFTSTGAIKAPVGTTAQRPAPPATGMIRFNSTLGSFEGYNGTVWGALATATAGGVTIGDTVIPAGGSTTTLDNVSIGPTTANAGRFTNLTALNDVTFSSTGAVKMTTGTTAERPVTPLTGMFRYNTTLGAFEGYNGTVWGAVGGGASGIASITGGTIDNTVIGGTTPAAGTFTDITVNGNTILGNAPTDTLVVNATPTFLTDVFFNSTGAIKAPVGTTAERPAPPANGMIRYNSTTNKFEAYENGAWTNVIGSTIQRASIVPTASQTVFTVPTYVVGANKIQIFVNGVLQEIGAGQDYLETNSTTITMAVGLTTADRFTYIIYS